MGIKSNIKSFINIIKKKEKIPFYVPLSNEELFNGKTALISGGSGGIGIAIADELLRLGCFVVIGGTNKEKLNSICIQRNSDNLKPLILNMFDISSFMSKVSYVSEISPNGKIDILINCAGINDSKPFLDVDEKTYDDIMNINVKGVYFLSQAVAKKMIEKQVHGHILNISSASSLRPASQPYAISKWAITGMTKGLADVLVCHGITVNALAPGPTATPMLGKTEGDDIGHASSPIGRYALPQEIARLAVFMVSDYGDLIVGDTFYMTGGSGVISMHR